MDRGRKLMRARRSTNPRSARCGGDHQDQGLKFAKFDETVEASMKLVHKSYQNVRVRVTLPGGTGNG